MALQIESTDIPDVKLVKPAVFGDDRGFFAETFRLEAFESAGIEDRWVQDNHSRSTRNVLRGLHFSLAGQAKLFRCAHGAVFDVAVDIRPKSPTYRRWVGVELSDENMFQLYIPVGFAHGFVVVSEIADTCYKIGNHYYDPAHERGVLWNDPTIGVAWPVAEPILSDRDVDAPTLDEIESQLPW